MLVLNEVVVAARSSKVSRAVAGVRICSVRPLLGCADRNVADLHMTRRETPCRLSTVYRLAKLPMWESASILSSSHLPKSSLGALDLTFSHFVSRRLSSRFV